MENDTLVRQRWKVQAYDNKHKNEWYFIGRDSDSLEQAIWYRDKCLKPANKKLKFRIIEESVIEKVVE